MNGHKNSPIGPDREDDVSPARKKLDCSIDVKIKIAVLVDNQMHMYIYIQTFMHAF